MRPFERELNVSVHVPTHARIVKIKPSGGGHKVFVRANCHWRITTSVSEHRGKYNGSVVVPTVEGLILDML